MYVRKFLFTFSFVLIGLISYLLIFSKQIIEKDLRAQYLKAGDFELSVDDQLFSLSQLQGRPVILYFGYSSCPDVCPVGLALIRDVLNSDDDFSDIPAIFVTLDPERDTAEKLREYVSFFHKNIIPLRGSAEETKSVIEAYGGFLMLPVQASQSEDSSEKTYLVDHSAYYYLIDAQGDLIRVFDHSVTSSELIKSLRTLL